MLNSRGRRSGREKRWRWGGGPESGTGPAPTGRSEPLRGSARGDARARSRGAEPRVLQALRGRGALLGGVAQRRHQETGEWRHLVFSPLKSVRQDGVEAAGNEPGDPQKSTCWRARKHSMLITPSRAIGCCSSPHTTHPNPPERSVCVHLRVYASCALPLLNFVLWCFKNHRYKLACGASSFVSTY